MCPGCGMMCRGAACPACFTPPSAAAAAATWRRCGPSAATCKKCASFVSDLYEVGASVDAPVYKSLSTGLCTLCQAHPRSSGCTACNAQGRCSACGQGYVLANGACKKVRRCDCARLSQSCVFSGARVCAMLGVPF